MKFEPDMIIALTLVVGSIIMICLGIDGEVKSILTMAAGWAFGRGYSDVQITRRTKR